MKHLRPGKLPFVPTVIVLMILLVAAFLRLHHFNEWPPGLSHDQAINVMDAYRLWHTGHIPLYIRGNRPEPLFRIFQALSVGLIGPSVFGARIVSVFFGLLTVAAAYRAGRHLVHSGPQTSHVTRRDTYLAALIAAGVLAVMIGHSVLSRVTERAMPQPLAMLLFFDAFVVGWKTGRVRSFAWAGLWVGVCLISYTAGLMMAVVGAIGLLYLGGAALILRFSEFGALPFRQISGLMHKLSIPPIRWQGAVAFVAAVVVTYSPMLMLRVIQPNLYMRLDEVSSLPSGAPLNDQIEFYARRFNAAWGTIHTYGDINPQYNLAQEPVMHTPALVAVLVLGIAGCMLRPFRLASWLAVAMFIGSLAPVALANEIPHGLRIVGAYASAALLAGAAVDTINRAGALFRPYAAAVSAIRWIAVLAVTTGIAHAAFDNYTQTVAYYRSDVRWGAGGSVSAFSWFFETRYQTIAWIIAEADEPVYLPASAAGHPSMRYFTLKSHPHVTTFARYFGDAEATLELPAGQFLIPYSARANDPHFVVFMPEGSVVLLPRFADETVEALGEIAQEHARTITDPYGEFAATSFPFPADSDGLAIPLPDLEGLRVNYDDQVIITGLDASFRLPREEGRIFITVYMQPGTAANRNLEGWTQLWTRANERVAASQQGQIMQWLYPPGEWLDGDVVPYGVSLSMPGNLPAGAYYVAQGLRDYRNEPVPVLGVDGLPVAEQALLGALKVPASTIDIPSSLTPLSVTVGDRIALRGYRLLGPDGKMVGPVDLAPGMTVSVILYWEALGRPTDDYTVFLHLHDSRDMLVAQSDMEPSAGTYPTGIWETGEVIATEQVLMIPAEAVPPFVIYTGMYGFPSLERLPIVQDDAEIEERRAVLKEARK